MQDVRRERVEWSRSKAKLKKKKAVFIYGTIYVIVLFSMSLPMDAGCQYNSTKQVHNAPKWYWQLFCQARYHLSGGFC